MRNLIQLGLLAAASLSLSAHAQVAMNAKIKTLNAAGTKVLVVSNKMNTVQAGDILELNENCTLEVEKTKGSKAVLLTNQCEDTSVLKSGGSIKLVVKNSQAKDNQVVNGNNLSAKVATQESDDYTLISKGIRLGINRSSLTSAMNASHLLLQESISGGGQVQQEVGFSLGHIRTRIGKIGHLVSGNYTTYQESSLVSLRLDANLTYGISKNLYTYAGTNLNKFDGGGLDNLGVRPGGQVGLGYQITENFGLNAGYVNIQNVGGASFGTDSTLNAVEVDVRQYGFDFALHGTF